MLIPTIHFNGNCDEAITFYKETLNIKVKEVCYAKAAPPDSGMDKFPPEFVMHSDLTVFDSPVCMTDGGKGQLNSDCYSFMIFFDCAEEMTAIFNKLADGGKIIEPLAPQFWSPLYGFVQDKFGVGWSICMNEKHCQSCGMPMCGEAVYGTNADGSKSEDYCEHCFANGKFTGDDCTMEQMIEECIPYVIEDKPNMSEDDVRKMLQEFMPTLKRWKSA